jgi:hypothetical protein
MKSFSRKGAKAQGRADKWFFLAPLRLCGKKQLLTLFA